MNKETIIYHDIFDYPLTAQELRKWTLRGYRLKRDVKITKSKYYFLKRKDKLVRRRERNERESVKKLKIAEKASNRLSNIPSIKFIGLTGSLAMNNAREGSDIDFLIITKGGNLWLSRLMAYFLLFVFRFDLRHPGLRVEKDRLCLNMWMDESDLKIENRNVFTAHELAQVKPLLNKDKTFEKLLAANKWILNYWPNAVKIDRGTKKLRGSKPNLLGKIAFYLQYLYMKSKITKEIVTPTRAFFHPFDWSVKVERKLQMKGLKMTHNT